MIKTLFARLHQGHRTIDFPKSTPPLPERFRGMPELDDKECGVDCAACVSSCPTHAISRTGPSPALDLGACIFCTECRSACPSRRIGFSARRYSLSARKRGDLVTAGGPFPACQSLEIKMKKLFGRSLKLRQVSAGGVRRL
jgi:formate hydrogenlyase subunit 6/NADH:ubiquinone oxidoreductase subunit I